MIEMVEWIAEACSSFSVNYVANGAVAFLAWQTVLYRKESAFSCKFPTCSQILIPSHPFRLCIVSCPFFFRHNQTAPNMERQRALNTTILVFKFVCVCVCSRGKSGTDVWVCLVDWLVDYSALCTLELRVNADLISFLYVPLVYHMRFRFYCCYWPRMCECEHVMEFICNIPVKEARKIALFQIRLRTYWKSTACAPIAGYIYKYV